jgi:putative ABC transport system substrate-binding protein
MKIDRTTWLATAIVAVFSCAAFQGEAQQTGKNPGAVFAQSMPAPGKTWRIGFLANGSRPPSLEAHMLASFARGMREFGYVESKDYIIEWRFAEGRPERFASFAEELVKLNVDVLVAATAQGVNSARRQTTTVPIVMVTVSDPVRNGWIASLARPGGNITGLSNIAADLGAKYVELLRAARPTLTTVAVLANFSRPGPLQTIKESARREDVRILPLEALSASQLETAFRAFTRDRADAVIVIPDAFYSVQSRRIAELAVHHRLPTMFWTREHVEAGGFMSYGQNNAEHYHRAAYYVDKILKGAKPGDLPVEQATKLELVINVKTAKAIGLTIPPLLLVRADHIIE